jgi:hypothetical protein
VRLEAITRREADIFACVCATLAGPGGRLPALADTDAVAAYDRYVAASPPLNRLGLRAALYALERAPLLRGSLRRLRQLPEPERLEVLIALERSPLFAPLAEIAGGLAKLAYYGDPGVMKALGYDAAAVVARGRELRIAEARW